MGITTKSSPEIEVMRKAGKVVAGILATLAKAIRPGITTGELDIIAVQELKQRGATSSFKGYNGFPAHLCVSLNEEVVHGIPGPTIIKEGDIVGLDFGAIVDGFQADAAITVAVGKVSPQAQDLIDATRQALQVGINASRVGSKVGDISWAIQSYVESRGFSVVREYVGHGIGRVMHEEPQVPNFGSPGQGPVLKNGTTLALEPMVNAGGWRTKVKDDKWTVITADGSLSAHFEHTIAITDGGVEILTPL